MVLLRPMIAPAGAVEMAGMKAALHILSPLIPRPPNILVTTSLSSMGLAAVRRLLKVRDIG